MISLSVIIVSYKSREMTLRCLGTLVDVLKDDTAEIIVVDNASGDDTAEAVRKAFPRVQTIVSERNIGFGPANNLAMQKAVGRYFLLLNSDAFPRPGAIEAMVKYLDAHPDFAVVGPRLLNEDETLQLSCYRFPSPGRAWLDNLWIAPMFKHTSRLGGYRRWAHDQEQEVDWVSGACFMMRREAFAETGGFDERFFLYAEETDWEFRMRKAGWKIGFTPEAQVVHVGGASGKGIGNLRNFHFYNSLDLYIYKHYGKLGFVIVRMANVVGNASRLLAWSMRRVFIPRLRAQAGEKVRLHSWLLVRQLTCWRLSQAGK